MAVAGVDTGDAPDRDRYRRVAGDDIDVAGGDQVGQGKRVMLGVPVETREVSLRVVLC
jgi:hypothetical protein